MMIHTPYLATRLFSLLTTCLQSFLVPELYREKTINFTSALELAYTIDFAALCLENTCILFSKYIFANVTIF